jgi:integration host factor subunit beta
LSREKLKKQLKEKNPKLNHTEIEAAIEVFSISIINALKEGSDIEIRGLGRWFCKKLRENFNARNPRTNELIYKPERVKVRFKSSKKLNKIINK